MLATFTDPTMCDVRRDLDPLPKLPHVLYSHLISFFGQPDDGPHTGPKHVVVYYISIATNCNIVVFMTVCIYRYIHTTALYY